MARARLYKWSRIRLNLIIRIALIYISWMLRRIMKIEETWLDEKRLKLIKGLFVILYRVSERQWSWNWETEIGLARAWLEGAVPRNPFFFLPRSVIVLDDGFADHVLVIFWIILATTLFAIEWFLLSVLTLTVVWWIRMTVLVRVVVVSIEKPAHCWKYTFWTWLKIINVSHYFC